MARAGFLPPLELTGRYVALVPMAREHAAALARAGRDGEIWRYLPYGPCTTPARMGRLIEVLLERQEKGTDVAFTVMDRRSNLPVGMTRYLELDRENRRAEIGGTWYGVAAQRTPCNTECKRLLLAHAFEVEGANRIQFKTDERNLRSQRAIERIGGTREGVLRDHIVMPDGFLRASVVYSIVAREWPTVREHLDRLLARPWERTPAGLGKAAARD